MKMFCSKCGSTLDGNERFCSVCGNETGKTCNNGSDIKKQKAETLARLFRWERKAWKIASIVFLAFAIFFIFVFILAAAVTGIGAAAGGSDSEAAFGFLSVYFFTYGFVFSSIFLAIAIVGFVSVSKIDKCTENMDTDIAPAFEKANSVGSIVLAALFNEIALVFVIIKFVYVKSNRSVFNAIMEDQKNR